jgi:hypothetical protein
MLDSQRESAKRARQRVRPRFARRLRSLAFPRTSGTSSQPCSPNPPSATNNTSMIRKARRHSRSICRSGCLSAILSGWSRKGSPVKHSCLIRTNYPRLRGSRSAPPSSYHLFGHAANECSLKLSDGFPPLGLEFLPCNRNPTDNHEGILTLHQLKLNRNKQPTHGR